LFNPTTEEKVTDVSSGDERDVDLAVEAAKEAFKSWKNTTANERSTLLLNLADVLPKYRDEMAYLDAVTMGAPIKLGWGVPTALAVLKRSLL
jgi:acyl-CoA reductase-like NAD-dependent aldehyde dehydrogenase